MLDIVFNQQAEILKNFDFHVIFVLNSSEVIWKYFLQNSNSKMIWKKNFKNIVKKLHYDPYDTSPKKTLIWLKRWIYSS